MQRSACPYGFLIETKSYYFRPVLFALCQMINQRFLDMISWPEPKERFEIEGLIIEFQKCVFFVDGNKSRRWRPGDYQTKIEAYDGHKKHRAWSISVYNDIFGRFICLKISKGGAQSDRFMYTTSPVYQN